MEARNFRQGVNYGQHFRDPYTFPLGGDLSVRRLGFRFNATDGAWRLGMALRISVRADLLASTLIFGRKLSQRAAVV